MSLNTWIFVMVAGVLLSALGVGLIRRVFRYHALESHNHPLGYVHSVVGVLYAVLVAFVIVATWERSDQALHSIEEERRALNDILTYADVLKGDLNPDPQSPDSDAIYTLVTYSERYANDMLWEGIASMKTCSPSPEVEYDGLLLLQQLENLAPFVKTRTILDQAFSKGDELNVRRERRAIECDESLPPRLWILLFIGAIITVSMTWFYGVKSSQIHYLITAVTSLIITCSILLALSLEHPFRREEALEKMNHQFQDRIYDHNKIYFDFYGLTLPDATIGEHR